jgi:hypothetical protein
MKVGIKRPRPAMVIAIIALIVALTGTAFAALKHPLKPHSVGSRQIKSKAVTKAKLASNSVTTDKVAKGTLTGRNFDLSQLGTVPTATNAAKLNESAAVNGHAASCPGGTALIRGLCFDQSPSGPVLGVKAAADACRAKGGRLPTPQELFSVRNVIPLGDGVGAHKQFTDSYYYDDFKAWTVVVYSADMTAVQNEAKESEILANYEYICVYDLIR